MKKLLFSLLVSILPVLTGCGAASSPDPAPSAPADAGSSAAPAPAAEDVPADAAALPQELVVAGQEIAASLDPVQPLTSSYLRAVGAAEALFRVNKEGIVEPSLAEGAQPKDASTWIITLRSGVAFWSGKAVDADAVIASLERSMAEDAQAQPFLKDLAFAKTDDRTIEVKTSVEHLDVPLNLSYYQTVIHNVEAAHDAVDTMDLTGMYKVVEFAPKQKMVLEANDGYWGAKPVIRRVVHEEIADGQTRALSAVSGRSHVSINIPVTSLAQFEGNEAVELIASPVANTQTIYLNLDRPQLADAKVRQALTWALDREELALLGAEGQSEPVSTWLGSNPAFPEAKDAVYGKPDPAKAEQLLDEAGWLKAGDGIRHKDGEALTLKLMTWGGDKALGEALQHQWTKIGVKAEVQHGDYSLIQTARDSGEWDASIEAWSTFGDMYSLLAGQFSPEGGGNYGGFRDDETNRLLDELRHASDDATRRELALRVNERVAELAPVIALFPRPHITAVSKRLVGFEEHFRQFENIVNADLRFE